MILTSIIVFIAVFALCEIVYRVGGFKRRRENRFQMYYKNAQRAFNNGRRD